MGDRVQHGFQELWIAQGLSAGQDCDSAHAQIFSTGPEDGRNFFSRRVEFPAWLGLGVLIMKKQAAILVFSDLRSDARVQRQILSLAIDYRLTVFALGTFDRMPSDARFVPIRPVRGRGARFLRAVGGLLGFFEVAYWNIATVRGAVHALEARGEKFSLWVANDIETVPLALRFAEGAPVWFDAHEFSPREYEEQWVWRILHQPLKKYLCRTYIPRCAGMSTVSGGIAEAYFELSGKKPIVVLNAPSFQKIVPVAPALDRVRLVHHGAADPARRLEVIIHAIRQLHVEGFKHFEIHFYLVANSELAERYMSELRALADGLSAVHFHDPVPTSQICQTLNAYDIGIISTPPLNFNAQYSLPNKFFDYIQARVPVISGPLVEIESWVQTRKVGWIARDFSVDAFVEILRKISIDELARKKSGLECAAREGSSEQSLERFKSAVQDVLA